MEMGIDWCRFRSPKGDSDSEQENCDEIDTFIRSGNRHRCFCGVVLAAQSVQSQTYQEKVLYAFKGGSDGANPSAEVIEDAKGKLYRTTITGDLLLARNMFKLSRMGKEIVLHRFNGGDDGKIPAGPVIMDAEGSLYGTTFANSNEGTVFKLSQTGKETVLHRFTGGDGSNPNGPIQDEKRNVYGTTCDGGVYTIRYGV